MHGSFKSPYTVGKGGAPGTSRRLADAPTLFANQEVQAALAWKYGRFANCVFVESVWPLLDEYRAYLANRAKAIEP